MIKLRFIGKKPYKVLYKTTFYHLTPGKIIQIPKKAALKIKASKFRRLFEVVVDEPTIEETFKEIEDSLVQARDIIISLRNRIIALEAHHP